MQAELVKLEEKLIAAEQAAAEEEARGKELAASLASLDQEKQRAEARQEEERQWTAELEARSTPSPAP